MRENPDGNPLVAIAAGLRGVIETVNHLFTMFLELAIAGLETLNQWLTESHGSTWWVDTPMARFARKD